MTPETPTAAALAQERQRLLAELLAAEGLDAPDVITPRPAGASVPLTFAQEILWLLDRATPGLSAYNTPVARRVRGPLDVGALARALGALVARHEALRTVFAAEGDGAVQHVLAPAPVDVALFDVGDTAEKDREARALDLLRVVADTPFDLAREPGFRVAIARLAADDHLVLFLAHHIVSDAGSFGVMLSDLAVLYEAALDGRAGALPAPTLQYGDYAVWQRATLQGPVLEDKLAYWRGVLDGAEELVLPTDRPRPTTPGFAGARRVRVVPAAQAKALKALAQQHGGTLYMALLVAYATVLRRYAGQHDLVIGSAVAARARGEIERMVGYFSQALPMRVRAEGGDSFATLLPKVAHTVLGAFEHVDVPVESLVLSMQRAAAAPSHAPLFNCVLTMQEGLGDELRVRGATVTPVDVEASSTKFDLTDLHSRGRAAGQPGR